ncbi:MAG TPA: ribosome assembly cofactor RimP [Lentimicrobium sp.]|nr:ribosome assembly cofactor RimP [Lentimicrobium sp.]
MIKAEEIKKTVEEFLHDTDIFVVDVRVKAGNNITVLLDSDKGITIDDCVNVTRRIESAYNREVEDYNLTVSSAGIGQPLKLLRQYIKIIGKEIEVEFEDKTAVKGVLLAADSEKIRINIAPKKKKEIAQEKEIPFSIIKSVKEIVSFK